MGSWNKTCAITNLPIFSNDPVVAIWLIEAPFPYNYGGSTCYPDDIWKPLPFIVEGRYDDYGRVEYCDGDVDALLKYLQKNTVVGQDKEEDGETLTMSEVFELESRAPKNGFYSTVALRDENDKRRICHIQIKQDVFDAAVNFMELPDPEMSWRTWPGISNLVEQYEELPTLTDQLGLAMGIACGSEGAPMHLYFINRFLVEMGARVKQLADIMGVQTGTDDRITLNYTPEQFESIVKLYLLNGFFSRSRRQWGPTSGEGSQSIDEAVHQFIVDKIQTGLDDIRERFEE